MNSHQMKCIAVCAAVLIGAVSGGVVAATDPLSKANRLPPSLEQKVQDFQDAVIKKRVRGGTGILETVVSR